MWQVPEAQTPQPAGRVSQAGEAAAVDGMKRGRPGPEGPGSAARLRGTAFGAQASNTVSILPFRVWALKGFTM